MANKPESFSPSEVQDRTVAPLGVLPKNMQSRVVGGVAAAMIAVIGVSAMRSPKERITPQPPPAEAMDPNTGRIQEYQERVEEQTRKLQLEQAALNHQPQEAAIFSKEAGGSTAAMARPKATAPPGKVQAEQSPEQDVFQRSEEKRNDGSLFASNVALTYRNQNVSETNTTARNNRQEYTPGDTEGLPGQSQPQKSLPAVEGKKEYRILEGSVLETVLTNRLDGAFSGPVNCMVTTDVYSPDGRYLLIPQGSRVLGEVHKVETFGQQRLMVAFHRLIMPNGYSLNLDQFQGLNQIGETGLRDQVNHHYLQVFGMSLAIAAIAGLGEVRSGSTTGTGTVAYEQGVASSLSQSSLRILDRYLNVVPTFTIREGNRVKIYLSGDLVLPSYDSDGSPR